MDGKCPRWMESCLDGQILPRIPETVGPDEDTERLDTQEVGMLIHACKANTREVEARGLPQA